MTAFTFEDAANSTGDLLLAGAIAYAADTYKGTRDLAGDPQERWELLQDHDKAACLHKARVVLQGAGVIP